MTGELNNFTYLMENTKYSNASIGNYGYWLESAYSGTSSIAWHVGGSDRRVSNYDTANSAGVLGVRPAIEVPKSNIEY